MGTASAGERLSSINPCCGTELMPPPPLAERKATPSVPHRSETGSRSAPRTALRLGAAAPAKPARPLLVGVASDRLRARPNESTSPNGVLHCAPAKPAARAGRRWGGERCGQESLDGDEEPANFALADQHLAPVARLARCRQLAKLAEVATRLEPRTWRRRLPDRSPEPARTPPPRTAGAGYS